MYDIVSMPLLQALGCLLYKLCFMSTPFGEQALAIVSAHFTVPEESPYSDQLHSLMSKCHCPASVLLALHTKNRN